MEEKNKEWFASWFDTPEYHQLYAHRDLKEAEAFIDTLLGRLALDKGSKSLDLACGAGRHAQQMARLGLDAHGMDLSAQSITKARGHFPEVEFQVGDMRQPFGHGEYDLVTNLFTSFGYFSDQDGQSILRNVAQALRPDGLFVLDFLNAHWVETHLKTEPETKKVEQTTFHIQRRLNSGWVVKDIQVSSPGKGTAQHQERVRLYRLDELTRMLSDAGLQVLEAWGDYVLGEYDRETSERLIILARKP